MFVKTAHKLLVTALLLLPVSAAAVTKPSIAVLDFDMEKDAIIISDNFIAKSVVEERSSMLSGELVNFLVNSRKFDVVERDRMDDLLKEHSFSQSGLLDPERAIQAGKLIGTDYLLMGKIEIVRAEEITKEIPYSDYAVKTTAGDMVVHLRIVDTRTGKIVASKKVKTHTTHNEDIAAELFFDQMKEETVKKMMYAIVDGIFPVKIVAVEGDTVFLNRGLDAAGFEKGDHLAVYSVGKELIDPETGESLGNTEHPVGEVVVVDIRAKKTIAKIVGHNGGQGEQGNQSNGAQSLEGGICRKIYREAKPVKKASGKKKEPKW